MSDATVLLVDDDADVRASVADALSLEGLRVVAAANGRDALDQLGAGLRPDLVLLDMMMPVMDGWAFRAAQLERPELAGIPVVVFTAYAVPDDDVRRLGAVGVLRKPLRLDDLVDAVRRCTAPPGPSP